MGFIHEQVVDARLLEEQGVVLGFVVDALLELHHRVVDFLFQILLPLVPLLSFFFAQWRYRPLAFILFFSLQLRQFRPVLVQLPLFAFGRSFQFGNLRFQFGNLLLHVLGGLVHLAAGIRLDVVQMLLQLCQFPLEEFRMGLGAHLHLVQVVVRHDDEVVVARGDLAQGLAPFVLVEHIRRGQDFDARVEL